MLFLLLLSNAYFASAQTGDCQLKLVTDIPVKRDPVYVQRIGSALQLALPITDAINLVPSQELLLACTASPGKTNLLLASNQDLTSGFCAGGNQLLINGIAQPTGNLTCRDRSFGTTREKGSCGTDGVLIESTFVVNNQYLPLIQSCHNSNLGKTYWSMHRLYGTKISYRVKGDISGTFSKSMQFKLFTPDKDYYQKTQMDTFVNLYGPTNGAKYIQPTSSLYLAKGHLAPDGDFLFPSWQDLSYFYVNSAPEWQSINNGNWKAVETYARTLAKQLNADLDIYTGTKGILSLATDTNEMKEAYLEANGIPVPELIWKIVRNPVDGACIVVLSTNNPFLSAPPTPICDTNSGSRCQDAGWPTFVSDPKKGYIYCCDYNSFKAVMQNDIPNDIVCSSLLKS